MSKEQLTDQQEHYCQLRAGGNTKTGAAKIAYNTVHPNKLGWSTEEKEHVQERIRQLKEERADLCGLDVKEQIRRYNEMYHTAISQNKLETAIKIMTRIDAIGGLDAPKVSLKGNIGTPGETFKNLEGDKKLKEDISKFSGILGSHHHHHTNNKGTPVVSKDSDTDGSA